MPDFNLDVLVPEMNFPHLIDHWATQEFLDVLYDDLDHAYDLQHRQPKLLMQDPRFKPTDVRSNPSSLLVLVTHFQRPRVAKFLVHLYVSN